MKKIISIISLLALIVMPIPSVAETQYATVFNPDTGDRKVVEVGDPNAFDGGYLLEVARAYELDQEENLGFSVVTNYSKSLASSINSTQTTLPVTSMTTKDGHTLTMSDFGSKVFLIIEPGKNKEEIVMCTGISSLNWTGCTRGLAFYGTSTASVAANKETHQSGSAVIISNVHYIFDELLDKDSSEVIAGDKIYTGNTTFNNLTATGTSILFTNVIPTASSTLPTSDYQLANKKYVDNVGAGGFTADNVGTTQGLEALGTSPEKVGINASSTGGLEFDTSGSVQIKASSTGGIAVDANGLYLDTSQNFNFSGDVTFEASTTWDVLPEYTSDPVNDNEATRKSYVDDEISLLGFDIGTSKGGTYFGYEIPLAAFSMEDAVGTNNYTDFLCASSDLTWYCRDSIERLNSTFSNLNFGTKNVTVEFNAIFLTPASVDSYGIGLTGTDFGTISSSTRRSIMFSYDATNEDFYARTGSGAGYTEEILTGISLLDWNNYKIEYVVGEGAYFYVNGTLVETITTNVPNDNAMYFSMMGGGNGDDIRVSNIFIKQEL